MAKALGYYTYTGTTEIAAGETAPLTNTIRQYGNCIRLRNNAVIIGNPGCPCVSEPACGYYTVSVNTTLVASAAGAVTVSLYQDGQLVPGAVQSATAAAANDMMNFAITAPVRVYRGQTSSKLQIYVNSQQVNTMNVAMEVVKE